MAEADTNFEIFGRKIFFLNPQYSVKQNIVNDLRRKEFEVYTIEDYRDAKALLRKYPGCILFINIDAQLSIGSWFNFVRSFEKEAALKTIYVSVISEKIKANDIELFEKFSENDHAVIDFSGGIDGISATIQEIITKLNAKGRRQYVRANLIQDKDAALFWNHGNKMHQLKIFDLSSVGMAVKIPSVLDNQIIAKNFVLQDVTMRLGVRQLVIEAIVFAVKKTEQGTMWVLLLHPSTPPSVKDEIRDYVFKSLENAMMISINSAKKDSTDYTELNYYNFASRSKTKTVSSPFSHTPGHNF